MNALRRRWRPLVAALSGWILAAAFPVPGWWWLAPFGVAGLTLAVFNRSPWRAAGLGLVCGLVFFGLLLDWMRVIGVDAWAALTLYCAVWIALTAVCVCLVTRLPGWPVWVACVWVLAEALRDRVPLGGFPWGRLAFSQGNSELVAYAALFGAPGVTFVVALAGGLLAYAGIALMAVRVRGGWAWVFPRAPRSLNPPAAGAASAGLRGAGGRVPARAPRSLNPPAADAASAHARAGTRPPAPRTSFLSTTFALAGVGVLVVGGFLIPLPTGGQAGGGPGEVVAAVVQGSVPRSGLDAMAQRRAVLDNHVDQTLELAARVARGEASQPAFVLWPENSSDVDPYVDQQASALITRAANAIKAPILVGTLTQAPSRGDGQIRLWNVGIVWNPGSGPGQFYVKRHPVPFGEYVPARALLTSMIGRYTRVPHDFAPGSNPGVLRLGPAVIGDVICFEIAYDEVVRDVVRGGGRLITDQTNNATYGGTDQPEQQVAMARLRAVEHGRTVLVAATSGVSAVIAPDGKIAAQVSRNVGATIVRTVPLRDQLSIADRLGIWPELLAVAAALAAICTAIAAAVISREPA